MAKLLVAFAAFVVTYRVLGALMETDVVARGVRVQFAQQPQDAWRELAADPAQDAMAKMIHHLETADPEYEKAAEQVAEAIQQVLTSAEDQAELTGQVVAELETTEHRVNGGGLFRRVLRRLGPCWAPAV